MLPLISDKQWQHLAVRELQIFINRRDQRAVCFASGLPVGPVSLSTTPVPLRKSRARHERASAKCRMSGGLPSGDVVVAPVARLHSTPFRPLRLSLARRQLQTEAILASSIVRSKISPVHQGRR